MKKFLKKLFTVINPPRCPKCRSTHLTHSYMWHGGWNELCGQAAGRAGTRCFDCGHIVWDQTDEEYEASLPSWCRAYKSSSN